MKKIILNGPWRMREALSEEWTEMTVPGSVYSALLAAGKMEDPFYRDNELAAFELIKHDYMFARSFSVTAEELASKQLTLCCEGLDTLAEVSVNGIPVGKADNMHVAWEWNVKSILREGENEISIKFLSPVNAALEAYDENPIFGSTDATPGFPHIRKAHCMYGWDWGARLPDAGIWRDIYILCADEARLESVFVQQKHEPGKVSLTIVPELKKGSSALCRCTAKVTAPDGKVFTAAEFAADASAEIVIDAPQLWWPNGFGAHPLYTVEVFLTQNGKTQDTWQRRIGLRTLTMSREKDQWGEEFCHVCNGVKIFAMGGDYIPEDNVFSRITPERTRRLLEDAVLANFNTVRVWGGGYYPDDFFYDICDELGILVWQDLMFACAYYLLTDKFEESITLEAEQNLRRLRHHASLALISGNNEMEEEQLAGIYCMLKGDRSSGFEPQLPVHHADYIKMNEYILPKIAKRVAPQTFWWPSSPSSGGNFDDPQDPNRGDCHYWDVWHGEKPFTDYRKYFFRYASEFGFQSFPCLKTVESFTQPDDRNIFSRVMERHQRNKSANGKILSYMSQTFRYPLGFDNLLYCSQLLQAEAIRYGVEHWRRNRGRCMGAVIWQLNDIWPVASWASIDYFGRWKALHYYAKRFFAPVMISACERGELDQNPHINEFMRTPLKKSAQLCVTNETTAEVTGTVCWRLIDPAGSVLDSGEKNVTVATLSSLWLDELDFASASVTDAALFYCFRQEERTVSFGSVLFCAPKHFNFAEPNLKVKAEGNEIIVTADAYAKSVYIESADADLLLSDNFFDMLPGQRRVTVLRGSAAEGLRVRSVYDMDKKEK